MLKGVYNAGPLFTEGEMAQRKLEGVQLRDKVNKDLTIYNPADYEFNGSDAVRTNKQIFAYDAGTIMKSGIGIFDLDATQDVGTTTEFGMFLMRAIEHDDVYVIAKHTDFRAQLAVNSGEIPGYSVNGFTSGSYQYDKLINAKPIPQIYVVNSNAQAIETVNAIYDVIKNNKKVDAKEFYKKYSPGFQIWQADNKFNIK